MDLKSIKNELNSILSCIDMSIDDNSIRSDLVLKTFHIFLLHSITLSYIFFSLNKSLIYFVKNIF